MCRQRALQITVPAVFFWLSGCHLCEPREVRHETTLTVATGQPCPSLDEARQRDPELDRGPAVVDVWIARCCYDVVVEVAGTQQTGEGCEEHAVHSDWGEKYLGCASREYRDARKHELAVVGDLIVNAPAGTIVSVTSDPRETRTAKERQCVYSKVTGHTTADTCG